MAGCSPETPKHIISAYLLHAVLLISSAGQFDILSVGFTRGRATSIAW